MSISNQLQHSQNVFCETQSQLNNSTLMQSCWPYHQQLIYQDRIIYVDRHMATHASIDKVENGYVVTIGGKKHVAKTAADIATLIEADAAK